MRYLNPTKPEHLTDSKNRPYFLWDCNMTRPEFEQHLRNIDQPEVRAYFAGKLLRQAKPDDVFLFLSAQEIADLWNDMKPYLGQRREFWDWLLNILEGQGHVKR